MLRSTLFCATILVVLSGVSPLPAQGDKVGVTVYQNTLKSTGYIDVAIPGTKKSKVGTGWLADRQRRIMVTNHHVINLPDETIAKDVLVLFPEYKGGRVIAERSYYQSKERKNPAIRAEVILTSPRRDLAFLVLDNVPPGIQELKLASTSPSPGERVHSLGNPAASTALWIYTSGTVRQVLTTKTMLDKKQKLDAKVIETQSPINPGDSGGPLLNDRGELIGVNSFSNNIGQLISGAIDITEVQGMLAKARKRVDERKK